MPQATLALTGTESGPWASTPPTGASLHHTLIDEAYPPGNTADYVNAGGDAAGTEAFFLEEGPADVDRVLNVHLDILLYGAVVVESPALRVQIWCAATQEGERVFTAETLAVWTDVGVDIAVDILGTKWKSGPRVVRFIPIDGTNDYGDLPTDP